MAIIFENLSTCPLCGTILNDEREFMLFPHFISNIHDPMSQFSDRGIHLDCLDKHPLKQDALLFTEEYHKVLPSPKSRSSIDGKLIENPEDILIIALLTSNREEELFKYNFLVLNKKNLSDWKERNRLIDLIHKYQEEGKWKNLSSFNYLDYLVKELSGE